jgi:hypothetical protein
MRNFDDLLDLIEEDDESGEEYVVCCHFASFFLKVYFENLFIINLMIV